MAFVSITRLRLRSIRFLPAFILWANRSQKQARRSEGNLAIEILRDARWTFWTKSAWKDEDSMRAFMLDEPHRSAMAKLSDWCDEASVAHWTQEADQLPDWKEAHRRMVAEGRRSRVRRASEAHERFEIAPPK